MREKTITALVTDLENKANDIINDFSDFIDGTRVLLLLERQKEGGHNHEYQRRALRFVTHTPESLRKCLFQMLILQHTINTTYRIYMTVNPRNLEKAPYLFKQTMLDMDYEDDENRRFFWERLEDRWISALMRTKPPKGKTLFVIDVDTQDTSPTLKKIAELELPVLKQYPTKNGWHFIVPAFNSDLWSVADTEIQKEGLLLLSYL